MNIQLNGLMMEKGYIVINANTLFQELKSKENAEEFPQHYGIGHYRVGR